MSTVSEEVAALKATLQAFMQTFNDATAAAATARQRMYEAQEKTNRALQDLDSRLSVVEPPAKDFAVWRERAKGAWMMATLLATMFGGLVVAALAYLWSKITGKVPG